MFLNLKDAPNGIPGTFAVQVETEGVQPMLVFSSDATHSDGGYAAEGKVQCRATLEPRGALGAASVLQLVASKAKRTRSIQVVDDRVALEEARRAHVPNFSRGIKQVMADTVAPAQVAQGQANKRLRRDREALQADLFQLFNRQQFWQFKDLADVTEQPQQWLKEVLLEVAQLVQKGAEKGLYELQPKYRISK